MSTQQLTAKEIETIIDIALDEDSRHGDITSESLIPLELTSKALILVKEKGVLAGMEIAERVFLKTDPSLKVEILIQQILKDGQYHQSLISLSASFYPFFYPLRYRQCPDMVLKQKLQDKQILKRR